MSALPEFVACAYPSHAPPIPLPLTVMPLHECSYLPGRSALSRAFYADRLPADLYHRFMELGFRRSGKVVYQPICSGCRACQTIRVPVALFQPDRSQRRCARRNLDLIVTTGIPTATDEKYELYRRYLIDWHGQHPDKPDDAGEVDDRQAFESFLYESPVDTLEFCYRDDSGRLLAVGICDVCPQSLSSVYFYFDPADSKRGLGTFGILHELTWAKEHGIEHYHLGYWVQDCAAMQYKANFRPHEILEPTGKWADTAFSYKPR